jgi:hypothetical protein
MASDDAEHPWGAAVQQRASKQLHNILDAIFESGDAEFTEATELLLRTTLRGVVSAKHMKRFPEFSAEAVEYLLLTSRKKSIRQKKGKNNV